MQSRWLRILLIGVFSLWFGIIVPGHERGAIRVAGANALPANGSAGDSCHATAPAAKPTCGHCPVGGPAETENTPAPSGDGSKHCAICKFIGVLDAPVMVAFDLPHSYQLATLEPLPVRAVASLMLLSSHRDRGPPFLFI